VSPWSADRAAVEPLAALAAVLAVGIGLSLYAGALSDAAPGPSDDRVAETTLHRIHAELADYGVVTPSAVEGVPDAGPGGYAVNVTLSTDGRTWRAGPEPPASAARATRRVPVRERPWRVTAGRLTVVVWS